MPETPSLPPGLRVCIWGIGRHGGGLAAARFCQRRGAQVQMLDVCSPAQLEITVPWPCHQGDARHPLLHEVDLIVCSPAIPPRALAGIDRPITCPEALALAEHRGVRYAVTGTKGKSTTAAALARLLDATVCGNSGEPIAAVLDRLGPETALVCELSSFQLWHLRHLQPRFSGGLTTSIGIDHLDWHDSLEHYQQAKAQLPAWCAWHLHEPDQEAPPDLPLLGAHNRTNIALAISAARRAGIDPDTLAIRLRGLQPLPHRLCPVHQANGISYLDDSAATNPQAAIAGIQAMSGRVVVIAGGSSKQADFSTLLGEWHKRAYAVVLLGATANKLAAGCRARGIRYRLAPDMRHAVATARNLIGDCRPATILLSPACASFGLFRDYAERGDRFAAAARMEHCHA